MNFKTILFIALFSILAELSPSQTKHALIVAMGNYPATSNWDVINSLNDTALIKNALVSSQQFSEKNIQVLAAVKATKNGIVDALNKLITNVKSGDVVVIHFSSHGQQLEDDNDDEIDGLDEVIVPYDAVFSDDKDKFDQLSPGYLRDDLFRDKVIQ